MAYSIKVLSKEPIIWETWVDFDPLIDGKTSTRDELQLLDAASRPMVLIVDIRRGNLTWSDVLYITCYGIPRELHDHPRLRRIVAISTSKLVKGVAQAIENSAVSGFLKVDLATSPKEALEYARQLLL